MKTKCVFYVWLALVLLCGCSLLSVPDPATEIRDSNLVRISYKIADKLLQNVSSQLNFKHTILVASFVKIKDMERSSNFGRVIAECITTRLVQKGYSVVEIKLRESVYLKENAGEFSLSQNAKKMIADHNAQTIVVGTYAQAREDIYISARLVAAANNKIISACDFKLPLSANLKALLNIPQTFTKTSL